MSDKNARQEKRIDMSARLNMRIMSADQHEAEQNQKLFCDINDEIDSKIQKYNEKLNHYIEASLKKTELKDEKAAGTGVWRDRLYGYRYKTIPVALAFTLLGLLIFGGIGNIQSSFVAPSVVPGPKNIILLPDEDIPMACVPVRPVEPVEEYIDTTTLCYLLDFQATIPTSTEYEEEKNEYSIHISKEIIAEDSVTGKKYSRKQLVGMTLLVPYTEDDKDIYFLGQYNENYRWDGYCVTNTYNSDGTLYGIYEYNFADGECLSCKSFYQSETDGNWIYLDREYHGNERYGKSIRYSFSYNVLKSFADTDVKTSDILYADTFLENSDAVMLTYYYGNMVDGKYNDGSGDAYEIIFDEDGFVKFLYMAEFSDGKVNDRDAREIVLDQSAKGYNYFYYNGPIEDNERKQKVSGKNYVTQEQINKILKDNEFECDLDLKWHQEN